MVENEAKCRQIKFNKHLKGIMTVDQPFTAEPTAL